MRDNVKFAKIGRVLDFFEEISRIPRGSGNTSGIADYLVGYANERGLECYRDAADNVIIKKPATKGYEARPTVILQGHTDIVAEKREGCDIDMATEGVRLIYDGDYLRADGTTLGGDDGVSVAYALALLDANDIEHPAIEAVFTSDEEIGLIGATALDPTKLDGRLMINIDSDDEGIFTVGCAGGVRVDVSFTAESSAPYENGYKLTVAGLQGGHSGIEIDKGRENAIKILGEALGLMGDIKIETIVGGNADNAIPRSAEATFSASCAITSEITDKIAEKYRAAEPDITVTIEKCAVNAAICDKDTKRIVGLINDMPSGVMAMSEDIPGLVETSLNMGIIRASGDFSLSFSVRSAKGAAKEALVARLQAIATGYGAEFGTRGGYPAWEYRKQSHLRDVMCDVYKRMYGTDAKVVTIHAGLECGIFSDKLEGLDCVSIGPDNFDIHTPEEHLSLPSTMRVWEYLIEVLKNV